MRIPKCRPHSSGQARVTINGKTTYLGPYGTPKAERRYQSLIAEWMANGCSKSFGAAPSDLTLAELTVDYLEYADGYYETGENSEAVRLRYALRPLADLYADGRVVDFGPQQYKAVQQHMIKLGWARSTIVAAMKRIVRMIKWGASEGKYPAAVYETLRLIPSLKQGRTKAYEAPPVMPVDERVVEETIKHCSPVVADMVRLQLLLGCRPGETVKFTPELFVPKDGAWLAKLPEHKTAYRGKDRTIVCGLQAQAILKPYMNRGPSVPLFSPRESEAKRLALLKRETPTNQGNRPGYNSRARAGRKRRKTAGEAYTTQTYGKAIRYACKQAYPVPNGATPEEARQWRKNKWWAPNRLRHTRATVLREKYGLDVAAAILGHSRVETTQIYARNSMENAIKAALEMG